MAELAPFNQGQLLTGITDPVLKGGICVALCDHWLALMKAPTTRTPAERMAALRAQSGSAMHYQKSYAEQRVAVGREEARARTGAALGHDFSDQTTVVRVFVGMAGIRDRMARDLANLGDAATWTMALCGAGRHAIAGYRGLTSITSNMHRAALHIFDPNVGEYVGTQQELDGILRDLFRRVPAYELITELSRTIEG